MLRKNISIVKSISIVGVQLLIVLAVLLLWQIGAQHGFLDADFVSTPIAVVKAGAALAADPIVLSAFGITAAAIGAAFVIGTGLGLIAGIALGLSKLLREAFLAPLLFVLSVPKSIFLPMFILFFGIGSQSAIAYGAFTSFFFVTSNVLGGIDLIEKRYEQIAFAYGASFRQRFTEVIFPSASPGIFAALWQGLHHALGGVLIMELFASTAGVGKLITSFTSNLQPAHALAIIFGISALAILIASVWTHLETYLSRWRQPV